MGSDVCLWWRLEVSRVKRRIVISVAFVAASVIAALVSHAIRVISMGEKRVHVVERGRVIRGAWQSPAGLRSIIERERIKTIVTLTPINHDDPKYVEQAAVVGEMGVNWVFVPMRGSRATLDQMVEAADVLADPKLQPVFFHCVAGHHRSSQAHAAYLIRHRGWTAERAWDEVSALPWARPLAPADLDDKALIEAFARSQQFVPRKALVKR